MLDVYSALKSKERILVFIKARGPSLPVQIARDINVSTIFASAFLSELKTEGKIIVSNMKVGSSPLYYLPGQELQLENFVQYLNQREKEAFELVKKEKFLEDEKQTPVIRVALRAIKDFAIDKRLRVNGDSKLSWKYFAISDDEFMKLAEERLGIKKEEPIVAPAVHAVSSVSSTPASSISEEQKKEVKEKKIVKKHKPRVTREKEQTALIKEEVLEKSLESAPVVLEKKKVQESEFGKNIREYLLAKDIELLSTSMEKKKEFEGVVRIDTLFGKQEFYLIVKDKKSVSDSDLLVALQKAQSKKMPALVMTSGELNKKAKEYLKEWGSLIKFEKIP